MHGFGRIAALAVALAVPCALRPAAAVAQPVEQPTAARAFAEAYRLYLDRLYAQASVAFDRFRQTYPEHPSAAEALYYQAESSLNVGREAEAVRLLTSFNEQYPAHPLAYQARLALGKYFFETADYEQAIRTFERVLDDEPPPDVAAKALYWMGEAALEQGQTDRALAYFQRAADDYRQTETAATALYTVAFTQVAAERLDAAARSFETLAARYPESNYAQNLGLALAEVYYELGQYERVVQEVERRFPNLSPDAQERANFLRAEAYNQLRDSENAIYYYEQFTENNPESPYYRRALYGLAWNYYFEDVHQWAADLFAQVREGHTDDLAAEATYYEAVNRRIDQQTRAAIELLEAVVETWPGHPLADDALFELGVALFDERRWADARDAFAALADRYPDSPHLGEAFDYQGNANIALGNFDDAFESFDEAMESEAASEELRQEIAFQKAWLLYQEGDFDAAAPAFLDLYEGAGAKASEALFWAAESFYQLGDLGPAARLFTTYSDTYEGGRHAEAAQYALGWVRFRQQDYAAAARHFERFLAEYRGSNELVPYRTDAQLRLADSYYALKQYPQAIRAYARVADDGGDYAVYQIGQAYANAGDAFEAVNTFRRLLDEYPESEWSENARYQLGYLFFLNQNFEEAVREYRTLVEQNPRDPLAPKAQYGIGDALYNAGQLEEATEAYRRVLERYPDSPFAPEAASSIFDAFILMDAEDRAEALVDSFATANPNSPILSQLRFRLAEARYEDGRLAEARDAFDTFLANGPSAGLASEALYYLGQIALSEQNLPQAENSFRRLVTQYPSSPRRAEAALELGEILLDQDRHREAFAIFRDLAEAASGDPRVTAQARYGQSVALLGLGRREEAAELLQQVAQTAPDPVTAAPAQLGLGRIAEDEGRLAEAARLYRSVVQQSRDEVGAEALYRLGALLHAQGQHRQAIEELSRMPTLFLGYGRWMAQGYLKQAEAFQALGERGNAAQLYELVAEEYAGTPYAQQAAEALTTIQ